MLKYNLRKTLWFALLVAVSLSLTDCQAGLKSSSVKYEPHPRLFFTAGQEEEILKKAEENALLADLISALKKEADRDLDQPLQEFRGDGEMLHVSREQISRVLTLSMAYRLFGEEKYAARVEEELLHVCGYPNWSPSHFLDVAEMTTAVAVGYDWCYDYLQPATRKEVENAIVEKAFTPSWPIYEKEGKTPFSRENNWNTVCNAGILNGALAIGDLYPAEAERILSYAVKYLPNLLVAFAPEGVFNEGPGYWGYNGMYMALLFDNLNRVVKNDFGLPAYEGLDNTARYYIEQTAPSTTSFNYGDASDHFDYSATFFQLSRQYDQPEVATFYRQKVKELLDEYKSTGEASFPRFFFLAIPWFDDREMSADVKEESLTVFNGITDLLIFNGGPRSDAGRLFLASKTGRASWSHNQLDAGSFVLECDSIRWGVDIGPDSYSLPDFWDYKPGGIRWNYFRNTNLSHSTITIDGKIAHSDGEGEIAGFNRESVKPWGIFDLTPCYPEQVISLKRGFKLLASKTMLVRDELELKPDAKSVSWRFVTRAGVTIDGNIATLTQAGKKFYVKCLADAGFQMRSFPAKPYTDKEKPIEGVTILEIEMLSSGNGCIIPVVMSNDPAFPGTEKESLSGLRDWK